MSMTDKAVDLALSQLQRLRDAGTTVAIPSDDLAMRAVRGVSIKTSGDAPHLARVRSVLLRCGSM